jgi:hypothetical protein
MLNLAEQIKSDEVMLGYAGLPDPEEWSEEIQIVEEIAYLDRTLEQNGRTLTHDYGELNWLAEMLGLPLDKSGGTNNA